MIIAKIKVDGVTAVATELSQIPKGIQGATVEVTYDGAWGSLNKTAVFSGSVVKDVVNAGAVIPVPPETVAKSGHRLRVGFYGVDGENKEIIPTLWVDLGAIQSAADPSGDASTNPSLPVWAQLQAEVEALKETSGGSGTGATPEQAAQIAQNKEDIEKLTREKLDASKLPEAVKEIVNEFGAVSYKKQTLTEGQKAQARENIGVPEIVCTVSGDVIDVTDSLNQKLRGLSLYGKTTQNGTPTPDFPVELESVGDDGSVAVNVCCKSLISFDGLRVFNSTKFSNGVIDNQNVITINTSTSTSSTVATVATQWMKVPMDGTYTFSAYLYAPKTAICRVTIMDNSYRNIATTDSATFTGWQRLDVTGFLSKDVTLAFVIQAHRKEGTEDIDVSFNRCMVEYGDSVTEYEAYKEPQTLTIQTPNGLPGIPVSSGGNYTDADGQQWICDEIDFARGKYIKRIRDITVVDYYASYFTSVTVQTNTVRCWLYIGKDEGLNAMVAKDALLCDKLPYNGTYNSDKLGILGGIEMGYKNSFVLWLPKEAGSTVAEIKAYLDANPLRLLVADQVATETDLTAEQIAQYSALHTNYPNTTIYNDEGAGMAVAYVADTKRYIDNKFTELQNAILSAGANI